MKPVKDHESEVVDYSDLGYMLFITHTKHYVSKLPLTILNLSSSGDPNERIEFEFQEEVQELVDRLLKIKEVLKCKEKQ